MNDVVQTCRSFIPELAEISGNIARRYFGTADLGTEMKADDTPVTRADREAEQALRQAIGGRFPEHGIIGEEFGNDREDAEWVWVLDPIDGTKSFAAGCPLFGTLIALLHEGQPVLGAIHQPILQQLCVGDGVSTTINGTPARVRVGVPLNQATLLTSDHLNIGKYQRADPWERLIRQVRIYRTWGDCQGYLLLASGGADIMVDPVLSPWDLMALIPVIRGAGGVITDWQGGDPVADTSIIAAAPEVHEQVVTALRE